MGVILAHVLKIIACVNLLDYVSRIETTAKQRTRMESEKKKPLQIRMTPAMIAEYSENAGQHFRTLAAEVMYRLAVLDALIARGEVNLNEFKF